MFLFSCLCLYLGCLPVSDTEQVSLEFFYHDYEARFNQLEWNLVGLDIIPRRCGCMYRSPTPSWIYEYYSMEESLIMSRKMFESWIIWPMQFDLEAYDKSKALNFLVFPAKRFPEASFVYGLSEDQNYSLVQRW